MYALHLLVLWGRTEGHPALRRLWHEEDGQDLVEYSLIVVLIGLGALAATDRLGDALERTFLHTAYAVTHGGQLP